MSELQTNIDLAACCLLRMLDLPQVLRSKWALFSFWRALGRTLKLPTTPCLPLSSPLIPPPHTGTPTPSKHHSVHSCVWAQLLTCCHVCSQHSFTSFCYGEIIDLVFVEKRVSFSLHKGLLSVRLLLCLVLWETLQPDLAVTLVSCFGQNTITWLTTATKK